MLKVLKFGGSSMADANQFEKIRQIVKSDASRRVVVVSAPGKRSKDDHKVTDLLYLCHAHLKYGVSCEHIFALIRERYEEIKRDCGLQTDLASDFDKLWSKMQAGISQDELVSRG
ncbi:MAG: aspartate kinase, partial [Oscillospiraceae bacterium]|nr:aspartate kinase [Oscillospiraceae bacterium]